MTMALVTRKKYPAHPGGWKFTFPTKRREEERTSKAWWKRVKNRYWSPLNQDNKNIYFEAKFEREKKDYRKGAIKCPATI